MLITSVENAKIKYLAKLLQAKNRRKEGKFLVEGRHLVEEARKLGVLEEAFSLSEQEGYTQVSDNVMRKLSNTDTVVSEIGLCRMLEKSELSRRILLLDGVQDPGNMGALMRSAKAFGFDTIILGTGCVDIYNDKVIRSSQGAIFKLNFIYGDLVEFITSHTEYRIYGTNVVNGIPMEDAIVSERMGIVLGNEGNGISDVVFQVLEQNIYIPMQNTESLNVSVAGGILMYYFKA